MLTCEFCGNIFSSKNSLETHKKKAVYCLKLRGLKLSERFPCKKCRKDFSEKRYLQTHEEICGKSRQQLREQIRLLEQQLKMKDQQIRLLEQQKEDQKELVQTLTDKLENVAVQGVKKHTVKNVLNLQEITPEHLAMCASLITNKHFESVENLAKFAVSNSFRDRAVCSDHSRNTIKYISQGKTKLDPKGKTLAKMFFNSIKEKSEDIIPKMREEIIGRMDSGTPEEKIKIFDEICEKMKNLIDIEKGIKRVSEGEEHDLKEAFVKQLCELLPSP